MSTGDKKAADAPHVWHRRMRDWACPDEVTFKVVPRYKTSGLSGDTWRTAVVVTAKFKGEVIGERGYRDMEAAMLRVPVWIADDLTCPLSDRMMELDAAKCSQPGCDQDAISSYLIKRRYSDDGDLLDASNDHESWQYERHFCARHLERGNAILEDRDANYLPVKGPGPGEVQRDTRDESPARQVVVKVGSVDEIPAALEKMRKGKKP